MHNDLYLWIIDYAKSLDQEGEKQLLEQIGRTDTFDKHNRINQNSFGKDITLIQIIYKQQTAWKRIEN